LKVGSGSVDGEEGKGRTQQRSAGRYRIYRLIAGRIDEEQKSCRDGNTRIDYPSNNTDEQPTVQQVKKDASQMV
jgi:hypothetical protein